MDPEMSDDSDIQSSQLIELSPQIILQPPLSRRGFGPGLIIVRPSHYSRWEHDNITLDPEPIQKWAEEGYAVIQITFKATQNVVSLGEAIKTAKRGITESLQCQGLLFGLIGKSRN